MRPRLSNDASERKDQESFWDQWNTHNRLGPPDEYRSRLRQYVLERAAELSHPSRILEIGCGTGWLSEALVPFGNVVGIDLSPAAVSSAQVRIPSATFLAGDFLTIPIEGVFDFIVTADTLAHFSDQKSFIRRAAELLKPGGTLLLMTQNHFVWTRSSYVQPLGRGQYRHWPTLAEIRQMLDGSFKIRRVTSLSPSGGNMGIMRVMNSAYVYGALRHLIGTSSAKSLFERLRLGRELVVLAVRV